MDTQQQLYGLMALAEENQKAVKAAIEGLAAERAALSEVSSKIAGAAGQIGPMAGKAMTQSLAGASAAATDALEQAAKPFIDSLSATVIAAGRAEARLNHAMRWFVWKWAGLVAGAVAAGCLSLFFGTRALVAWERHQVDELAEAKVKLNLDLAQLRVNVGQLQATADALVKKGGRAMLHACGEQSARLCVRIDTTAVPAGPTNDYYVLYGY